MSPEGYQAPPKLFRANDIRGIAFGGKDAAELTPEFAYHLGRAFASILVLRQQAQVWVCRDARLSSPVLHQNLMNGLLASGGEIIDLGIGPTPLICHAIAAPPKEFAEAKSGIMITASHNPPEHNGFKMIVDGEPFFGSNILQLDALMRAGDYQNIDGTYHSIDHTASYIQDFSTRFNNPDSTKIVLDAANGAAGPLALAAFESIGLEVIPLFCEMDGRFPNHSPDTSDPESLRALQKAVLTNNAFAGIALDGDGDRMVAVTAQGKILSADDLFYAFSEDVLAKTPGATIIFDVKTSRTLNAFIADAGGTPYMTKSGRSFVQSAMREHTASFAGEFSSHFFFADEWYASDDGIYAGARLIDICRRNGKSLSEACARELDTYSTSDIYIPVEEERKFDLVTDFIANAKFHGANLVTIDGLRIEYAASWALVRASNTSAAITLRFEADTELELRKLITLVQTELQKTEPLLDLGSIHVT